MRVNSGCYTRTVNCTGILDLDDQANSNIYGNKFIELSGLNGKIIGTNRTDIYPLYCENVANKCKDSHDINIYTRIQANDGFIYALRNNVIHVTGIYKDKQALTVWVITEKKKIGSGEKCVFICDK